MAEKKGRVKGQANGLGIEEIKNGRGKAVGSGGWS